MSHCFGDSECRPSQDGEAWPGSFSHQCPGHSRRTGICKWSLSGIRGEGGCEPSQEDRVVMGSGAMHEPSILDANSDFTDLLDWSPIYKFVYK